MKRRPAPEFLDLHLAGLDPEPMSVEPELAAANHAPTNGHRPARQVEAPRIPAPVRAGRRARALALIVTIAAFAAAGGFGGYLYVHEHDRDSAAALTDRQEHKVQSRIQRAVARAVAAKGASDHRLGLELVKRRLTAQKRADARHTRQLLLREQRAADLRAAAAFARGAAAGRESAQAKKG